MITAKWSNGNTYTAAILSPLQYFHRCIKPQSMINDKLYLIYHFKMKFLVIVFVVSLAALGAAAPTESCAYKGEMYSAGEKFSDDCNACECGTEGVVTCEDKECVPCRYMDGAGKTVQVFGPFNDGCNHCICNEDGVALCTFMYCPHKCHVNNDAGASGWIDYDTTLVHLGDTEGCVKTCTCKHNRFWIGAALYDCEDKCGD